VFELERVDFVTLPVRDPDRARSFYIGVLGFRVDPRSGELEAGNVTLCPWQPEAEGLPFVPNEAGLALRVPDVEAARRILEDSGVTFDGETVDTGVCRMAFFRDPDGNVLILHRRHDAERHDADRHDGARHAPERR
jgi:catechol 2,3-dioxygenase-like lactoylglutathione lyase family enzyme